MANQGSNSDRKPPRHAGAAREKLAQIDRMGAWEGGVPGSVEVLNVLNFPTVLKELVTARNYAVPAPIGQFQPVERTLGRRTLHGPNKAEENG